MSQSTTAVATVGEGEVQEKDLCCVTSCCCPHSFFYTKFPECIGASVFGSM
jgi:hypothetical protein